MENLSPSPVRRKQPLSPGVCRTLRHVQGGDAPEQKVDAGRSSGRPRGNQRKANTNKLTLARSSLKEEISNISIETNQIHRDREKGKTAEVIALGPCEPLPKFKERKASSSTASLPYFGFAITNVDYTVPATTQQSPFPQKPPEASRMPLRTATVPGSDSIIRASLERPGQSWISMVLQRPSASQNPQWSWRGDRKGPAFPSYPSASIFLIYRSVTGNRSSLQQGWAVTTLLLPDTELLPRVPPTLHKPAPHLPFPHPVAYKTTPERSLCEKLAPTLELAATLPIQKLRFQP
ncbi:hypothetical protein MJT46_018218 [Ovis ammon polii x Ovis aries]|nr:hypothetical protein MJT46_018218 [Ovis ammon polii x Ovis aries]